MKTKLPLKFWTPEELTILKENIDKPRKEVTKLFQGRTYQSVKQRMRTIKEFPNPRRKKSRPVIDRFEESISKIDNGCWIWLKSKRKNGYGRMKISGKDQIASHVAWEIYKGKIPVGMWVLHHCDNPMCVNPDHLFLGTAKDNKMDSIQKDRHAYGVKNMGGNKLSEEDVIDIKTHPRYYGYKKDLMARYHISEVLIGLIRRNKVWKHVTPLEELGK